jgi:hypothetical protein
MNEFEAERELRFLRYRRTVVEQWPEGPQRAGALARIDSRLALVQSLLSGHSIRGGMANDDPEKAE